MKILAIVCALGLMTACHKGPDEDQLVNDLQSRLNARFHADLLKITEVIRWGHHPYTEEGDDHDRLLIYYRAELEFLKAYKLSDWDELNVGSLISVLGATPHGVEGVNPDGNQAGDRISVRGAAAYVLEGDAWAQSERLPTQDQTTAPVEDDQLPYRRRLDEITKVAADFSGRDRADNLRVLANELERVLATSQRRLGRSKGWVTIATGNVSGEYYAQGKGLEKVLTRAGHETRVYESGGSIENCRLVDAGEVQFAYSQNDIAQMAHQGKELFADQLPLGNLRALSALYPEAVQVVVLQSSGASTLHELSGKRVDIGVQGSGARANALEVLRGVGLTLQSFSTVQGKGLREAIADLESGAVDAFFMTSAYPAPAIHALATRKPVKLISLDAATVAQLVQSHPSLIPLHIPARTYPGLETPTTTVGVTATLITHANVPAKTVEAVLSHLFSNVESLSRGSLQAYFISPQTARKGISIPMHPAAEAFLKSKAN